MSISLLEKADNPLSVWLSNEGISFQSYLFPFKDALVVIYQWDDNLSYSLIREYIGEVLTYNASCVYLSKNYTPEALALKVKEEYELEEYQYG